MESLSILAFIYTGLLAVLAVYGVHRMWMISRFRWEGEQRAPGPEGWLPGVTLQLPIYNERTVAARLVRAAGRFDYPPEKLEIQVLDDSNDETRSIVDEEVRILVEAGMDAKVLRRADRRGFKAGALARGMQVAKHDLFCIFDSDFLPQPDFLRRMLPHIENEGIGMVQARWGHENRDDSSLTRAQATLLDGHFVIEHNVRYESQLFFNFNGTAGLWRREAIEGAGGWQHDTLTEDLDLSYRAQLAGWRFIYAPHIVASAELPATISAFKSQQHRWAKGSLQVVRKLGKRIIFSKEPLRVRMEAMAHLTANIGSPCILVLALILPLVVSYRVALPWWLNLGAFVLGMVSMVSFYERGQRAIGRSPIQRLRDTLTAVCLGTGMCVSQTRAVLEGFLPSTGAFVRTPKRGHAPREWQYAAIIRELPGLELLLAVWFAWGLFESARAGNWGAMPFLLLFFVSFFWVGALSLGDALRARGASGSRQTVPEFPSGVSVPRRQASPPSMATHTVKTAITLPTPATSHFSAAKSRIT